MRKLEKFELKRVYGADHGQGAAHQNTKGMASGKGANDSAFTHGHDSA